jgi:hypothetical protein
MGGCVGERMRNASRFLLPLSITVLLIVGIELGLHADSLSVWSDEMWSIFHSGRSAAQILLDRDLGWPPGYFLLLHLWMKATGSQNDFVLHSLGVWMGLVAAACLIRIGRIWRMPLAGIFAALALGTSSYALYFILELRGYALMLLLESAFVLLYWLWLEQPSPRRSLFLASVVVAMLYTQFITILVIATATLHLLAARPRRLARWGLLLAVSALAFSPFMSQVWRDFQLRLAVAAAPLPSYFLLPLGSLFHAYSGHRDIGLAVVLVLSAVGWWWGVRRLGWATPAWLALWGVGIPLAAYVFRNEIGLFSSRYLVFTIPGAVLLVGTGLSALPRPWIGGAALVLLALGPWQPFDFRPSYSDAPPVRDFMREMAHEFRPGDRLIVDPALDALTTSLEWAYYKSLYLPQGDFQLAEPVESTGRRVWYLYRQGSPDPSAQFRASAGRVPEVEWGPWYLHAVLFEAPPEDLGVPFGGSLRFLGADVDRLSDVHAGDTLPVRLWWTSDLPTPSDFTVSIELHDPSDRIVARIVGPPVGAGGSPQIPVLTPGEILVDPRTLTVPYHMQDGFYTIQIAVTAPGGEALNPGGDGSAGSRVVIDRFHLASFATW